MRLLTITKNRTVLLEKFSQNCSTQQIVIPKQKLILNQLIKQFISWTNYNNTNLFDSIFMSSRNPHLDSNITTIPQRCLVALIDINKLRVNLSQLHQTVGKELQIAKGVVALAQQMFPKMIEEFIIKRINCSERQIQQSMDKIIIEKDERIVTLTAKLRETSNEKEKLLDLIKRQTDVIGKNKQEHEQEIQRLNYRINELYSIIHEKSATIEGLTLQASLSARGEAFRPCNQLLKSLNFDFESSYSQTYKGEEDSRNKQDLSAKQTARISLKQINMSNTLLNNDQNSLKQQANQQNNMKLRINDYITENVSEQTVSGNNVENQTQQLNNIQHWAEQQRSKQKQGNLSKPSLKKQQDKPKMRTFCNFNNLYKGVLNKQKKTEQSLK